MNTDNPLVSIVIPTKNRPALLKKTIESVLVQTFQEWEIIIVYNSSDENTEKQITNFIKDEPRIKFFNVPESKTGGISEYLNFGILRSSGK
ncbi:MAG: glycosyltransferase family 2 protein [Ignavibacteria bacterium]|nr:glycosyltransferase family 2 protein [Ignavibacteria bacterium]